MHAMSNLDVTPIDGHPFLWKNRLHCIFLVPKTLRLNWKHELIDIHARLYHSHRPIISHHIGMEPQMYVFDEWWHSFATSFCFTHLLNSADPQLPKHHWFHHPIQLDLAGILESLRIWLPDHLPGALKAPEPGI